MKQPAKSLSQSLLTVEGKWQNVFSVLESRTLLESILQDYLYTRRWFGGKARVIQSTQIAEVISIPYRDSQAGLVWLKVEYTEGESETYTLLLGYAAGEQAKQLEAEPLSVIAQLQVQGEGGVIFEATADEDFLRFPLEAIAQNQRYEGMAGQLVATKTPLFNQISGGTTHLKPSLIKAEQSNTSIIYGDRLILKFFRKIEEGINPDFEIGRFLFNRGYVEHFASIAGALEYQRAEAEPTTIATLQEFIHGSQDAWKYTLLSLQDFFKRVREQPAAMINVPIPSDSLLDLQAAEMPALASATIGTYLHDARLLGERTAQLHVALASDSDNPDFAPEPFTSLFQRSIYQNLRTLVEQNFGLLQRRIDSLSSENQQLAQAILACQDRLLERFELVMNQPITASRTRCHGDYHLGQVLYTGKDFIIIDFEGEPARPLQERRMKLSPLRDVAGMLQSFNYAANMGLRNEVESETPSSENLSLMKQWGQFWCCWVSAAFLNAYLETAEQGSFLPKTGQELQILLDIYLFEKAAYELGYELNNRPDWVDIPLQRLLQL